MCNPLKKTSSPRKNVNVFFFNHIPLPTPRKYFNRHCKISITRTNPPPHSKNLNSLEYVNSYSIPPIIFFPIIFLCFVLQFSKRIPYLFIFLGGGVEPPDPPPLYTPLYIVHKILYHATAVCKLRCIEVIFVIK